MAFRTSMPFCPEYGRPYLIQQGATAVSEVSAGDWKPPWSIPMQRCETTDRVREQKRRAHVRMFLTRRGTASLKSTPSSGDAPGPGQQRGVHKLKSVKDRQFYNSPGQVHVPP